MKKKTLLGLVLTLTVSVIRIGMGYFISLSGPNLLYLASNVDVSVGTVSYMFVGGSIGVVIGAVFGAIMKKRMKDSFRHLYALGAAVLVLGACSPAIPYLESLWLLCLIYLIGGIVYGYLDAGLQALILELWEEKSSRIYIQIFHFTYSIGAFAAPLVSKQMQEIYGGNTALSSASDCRNQTISNTTVHLLQYPNSTIDDIIEKSDLGFKWTYYILAVWLVPISVVMTVLACINVERKLSTPIVLTSNKSISTKRQDDSFKDVVFILIAITGYYFCSVGLESVFYSFIYSVTLCSDLQFTPTQASYANSLVWLGLGVGRILGIIFAKRIEPRTIIICGIAGTTFDSLVFSIWGEKFVLITWIVAFTHGVSTATLFPAGVSWVSQVTNVSGSYMFIFNFGSALGALTMLPIAGYLFDKNPFNTIYLVFALSALNGIFFALAVVAARSFKYKTKKRSTAGNSLPDDGMKNVKLLSNIEEQEH